MLKSHKKLKIICLILVCIIVVSAVIGVIYKVNNPDLIHVQSPRKKTYGCLRVITYSVFMDLNLDEWIDLSKSHTANVDVALGRHTTNIFANMTLCMRLEIGSEGCTVNGSESTYSKDFSNFSDEKYIITKGRVTPFQRWRGVENLIPNYHEQIKIVFPEDVSTGSIKFRFFWTEDTTCNEKEISVDQMNSFLEKDCPEIVHEIYYAVNGSKLWFSEKKITGFNMFGNPTFD